MKFRIPKIVKALDLKEYDAAFVGENAAVFQVWVNPSKNLLDRHDAMVEDARKKSKHLERLLLDPENMQAEAAGLVVELESMNAEQREVMAELWSQGHEPESHWTADEIQKMVEETRGTDPQLYTWLCLRTVEMIADYRVHSKKASEKHS